MRFLLFFLPFLLLADAHIFVLHRIGDNRYPSTNTSINKLEKYLKYVTTNGYKVVTLSKLAKMIKNKENIDKVVVFCEDDGYKSFYKNGLPLFKKYKVPFTLFVYTKATTQKWGDFMSWKEVRKASEYGELGVHSWAHPHLAKLSNQQIIKNTKKAIGVFKKYIGYVPKMYAYPYGEYDERVKKIISKYFDVIVNQNSGAVNLDSSLNDLDRIALTGRVNIAKKLKIKVLDIKDLKIKRKGNKIIAISGRVNKPYVNIYITGFGWKGVKVKNGFFYLRPEFKLKRYRNRVIIRYNYEMISKLILKEAK
jgi:peptidoglycan/xylan/chitin deacetylase (PgdA/CDA1 family)